MNHYWYNEGWWNWWWYRCYRWYGETCSILCFWSWDDHGSFIVPLGEARLESIGSVRLPYLTAKAGDPGWDWTCVYGWKLGTYPGVKFFCARDENGAWRVHCLSKSFGLGYGCDHQSRCKPKCIERIIVVLLHLVQEKTAEKHAT